MTRLAITKQEELLFLVLLIVIVGVAVVSFRSQGKWVDALLIIGLLGTAALLALVMLSG